MIIPSTMAWLFASLSPAISFSLIGVICRYHTRCPYAMPVCRVDDPELFDLGDGHRSACHLVRPPH